MEKVYDLHQHTHCVIMHFGKKEAKIDVVSTSTRKFKPLNVFKNWRTSITYNKHEIDVTSFGRGSEEEEGKEDVLIDNFRDGLYDLFKKDREAWDEEDNFLMKAVSDYLRYAVKYIIQKNGLKIENYDLLHYAFVVPSEWEEEVREDILRPIFVQSGLISNEDHQDRLLFYTDTEAICYSHSFKRGENTILCRIAPEEEEIIVKFDLIQTTTTLFNIPGAKFFPKVMKSSSVSVPKGHFKRRIKDFLRANLFPTVDDGGLGKSLKYEYVPSDQVQIIEAITDRINRLDFLTMEKEKEKKRPWITFKEDWMLSESQKEFISSLCPSIIYAKTDTFLIDYMTDIISNNSTKRYKFFFWKVDYFKTDADIIWIQYMLEYHCRSLNYVDGPDTKRDDSGLIINGVFEVVFEAIQHSDMYCKPRIAPSEDLSISSSVFINSKPDAIISLDISLKSTLFTCSNLDEDGLIQEIFDHDHFIGDRHLPPLGYFFTFSDRATLNVKVQFILFAKKYLLGDLNDFIADDGVSIKKDLLDQMKVILTKDRSDGKVLVSTRKQKYIKAFILMYMLYIKEEILDKLPAKLVFDKMNMKIGYAVSIEAMLLKNTVENKDNLRDIIYTSGLVLKDDDSKKLRITTQGEGVLPAIQKSLELKLSLKSYFLLCQLHEDYVQLSLHQVVTEPSPEEEYQESIIVQDEIIPIQNIYDSLCLTMWRNLQLDNSLIELCEVHSKGDNNEILELFFLKAKTEFFANLKGHISDNLLQNNPDTQSTNTVSLSSSCNCNVRLETSDIINISFTPVLQDISHTLYASLLNKELFGNYMNIDYLFTFIHFNNNPKLQHAFARILEEEADDFNLELGIDTSCLVVPELFSQLLRPVIALQPLCYKDFKVGALQQVSSENYAFSQTESIAGHISNPYKLKITDTETIECGYNSAFPLLNKGEVINNVRSSRKIYLWCEIDDTSFYKLNIGLYKFETMNYMENNETLSLDNNIYQQVGLLRIYSDAPRNVDTPIIISVKYVSYTSSFLLSAKIVGADPRNKKLTNVIEIGEPLTLTRS